MKSVRGLGVGSLLVVIACAHEAAPSAEPVVALDQSSTYQPASSPPLAAPAPSAAREHGAGPARLANDIGPCKTSADCTEPARCEHAVCACPSETQACGGKCISIFDTQNCGACGKTCSSICLNHFGQATCGSCDAPYAACGAEGGRCTNLDDDSANCGACGKTCGKNTACARGRCVSQRKLGAACTDDDQCEALPGSCVDGRCACTGSYRAKAGRCQAGSEF